VTRLRHRIASLLLDLAVRVEPKAPRRPLPVLTHLAPIASPARSAEQAAASAAAGDLRRLAASVEDGHVIGFHMVWCGAPHAPEVAFFVPAAIGDA
jgi:hypothetical protein